MDITPHAITNPGGKEMPHDPRDFTLLGSAVPYPAVFTQQDAWNQPVYYQGQQPACGAHSGTGLKVHLDDLQVEGKNYTPRFTWADIKTFDGFPIDAGTDMRSIFKSLKNAGALKFVALGNDVTLPEKTYASAAVVAPLRAQALPNTIDSYAFLTDISIDNIKRQIYLQKGVLLLLRVGSTFWQNKAGVNSWQEKDILPLRVPTQQLSGHFVFAHSYDEKYVYFLNSFGDTWGRKGHGYFGAEYQSCILGAGTAVDKDASDVVVPVYAFVKNLQQGMTDTAVMELQKYLNAHGAPVAASGAGSVGHETTYFGPATEAALVVFQKAHAISPASGFFGPITRKFINKS